MRNEQAVLFQALLDFYNFGENAGQWCSAENFGSKWVLTLEERRRYEELDEAVQACLKTVESPG